MNPLLASFKSMTNDQFTQLIFNMVNSSHCKKVFCTEICQLLNAGRYGKTWNILFNRDGIDHYVEINHIATHQYMDRQLISKMASFSKWNKLPENANCMKVQLITHFERCDNRRDYALSSVSTYNKWNHKEEYLEYYLNEGRKITGIELESKSATMKNGDRISLYVFARQSQ